MTVLIGSSRKNDVNRCERGVKERVLDTLWSASSGEEEVLPIEGIKIIYKYDPMTLVKGYTVSFMINIMKYRIRTADLWEDVGAGMDSRGSKSFSRAQSFTERNTTEIVRVEKINEARNKKKDVQIKKHTVTQSSID